ncbi:MULTISPECIES: ABC transporter substrate-binding protein [Protofrankia]|uniref:ABC-type transporter, periplasmic subunit n=1 Tax=Candidatus Protofrankia datiscae TaxID=2716812 RepID=F8AVZ3_9ACTN|nr:MULTISPECIES: ABC transporter substrate-binding protein [Protofrankia]AEH09314.1 ABC-type transporter, periplasmic subunit [Candidatus Protofrankia datiscae]
MRITAARKCALVALVASAVGLTACGSDSTTEGNGTVGAVSARATAGAGYPVDIQNCGRTLHFDRPPTRIVSGWTTSTELLIALGAAEKIVGQYNTSSGTPLPQYAEVEKKIPTLSASAPTREALLAARPDLIWADGSYLFDGQQLPTIDDLKAQGIQVLILSGFCTDDASKARVRDVDADLTALGRILGVTAKADELKADIDNRLRQVAAQIAGRAPVPVALISSFNGTIYTYEGVYSDIARLAGATNIYAGILPAGKYYGQLSVEDITKKDPATLVYLLSGSESEESARKYLTTTFPTLDAVKNNKLVFLPQSYSTNLSGVDGVVRLAAALHSGPS